MAENKGKMVEASGLKVFQEMGFFCLGELNNVPLINIDPDGPFSKSDHLEIDYLISEGEHCFFGEITTRSNAGSVSSKYKKFKNHLNTLKKAKKDDQFWLELGVPKKYLSKFRATKYFKGFFILTDLQRFDVKFEEAKGIITLYKTDWDLIKSYSESIGLYAKNHLLEHFNIKPKAPLKWFQLSKNDHALTVISQKKVASGEIDIADVFSFQISPYEILEYSRVYRRDNLPLIEGDTQSDYQRPLDTNKLSQIRKILLNNIDFTFPNNILCVLSDEANFKNDTLSIPEKYGAFSIIDGQHRLFSFANANVKKVVDSPKIMVTAIKFRNANEDQINKYSARTFVEINTSQTKIDKTHLDFISYEILDDPNPRALAAQVVLRANERDQGSLYGIFDTNQTGLGIIKTKEIISALKSITNFNRINRIKNSKTGNAHKLKIGYENLFRCKLDEIDNPEILISKATTLVVEYFDIVKKEFVIDWPKRGTNKNTSLKFAKVFVAFIRLLYEFLKEGKNWRQIEEELKSVKNNVLHLRNMTDYDKILFLPESEAIPDSKHSASDDYKFLNKNRTNPTSIIEIVKEKYMKKIK
jgi:DGQHR domain-containing protein